MTGAPLLTTERFDLFQPRAGDHAGLCAMLDDTETTRFLGGMASSASDAFARLLRNAGSWALYGYGSFVVREKGQDRIVGSCGVFRSFRGFGADVRMDDVPEAGWIVHRDLWGQGAATEIMRAVLAWFDATHGRQRIACMIEEGNDASVRVAERLGFTACGSHAPDQSSRLQLFEICA
ncbi:GNAT family N-acetyltransferase [Novosphingobium aquiterrae]|uniref:GNAT family N-acetyltransferase n=1 Tax=Novosphingobium aquiterrae TaxID=624388 RepID=A0ABV6PIT3_9SPHN